MFREINEIREIDEVKTEKKKSPRQRELDRILQGAHELREAIGVATEFALEHETEQQRKQRIEDFKLLCDDVEAHKLGL